MKEDKLLDDLFESARTEDPKRSYEEVADSFIKTVPPTGLAESVKELLLNNINFNSILVVATSGVLLTAALMMSSPTEATQENEIISQNTITQEKTILPIEQKETILTEQPQQETEQIIETSNNTSSNTTETSFPKKEKVQKQNIIEPVVATTTTKETVTNYPPVKSAPTPTPKMEIKDTSEEVAEKIVEQPQLPAPSSIPKPVNASTSNNINATNDYNELFTGYGTNLRKLKRNLLSKLVSDGFIESKKDDVLINIEEKKVVVNGIQLKPYYYTKYTSIIQDHEIVPNDNRQIRINDDVILVGEFSEAGFKGKGEGYGDALYLPDYQKDIQLGNTPININLSPTKLRKGKISWDENIFQQILDIPQFESIFRKDNRGNYLPLTILTNNQISSNLNLHFKNQSIKLIRGESSLSANAGLPIIYMEKYKFGKKKGTIRFLYDGYEITVQLKRFNNDWLKSRFQVKGKKENQIDVKF